MSPEALTACARAVETAAAHALAGKPDDGVNALERASVVLAQLATELPAHAKVRRVAHAAAQAAADALAAVAYAQQPVQLAKRYEGASWADAERRDVASDRREAAERSARCAQRAAARLVALVQL